MPKKPVGLGPEPCAERLNFSLSQLLPLVSSKFQPWQQLYFLPNQFEDFGTDFTPGMFQILIVAATRHRLGGGWSTRALHAVRDKL
jgi:hypothetical protein